MTNKMRKLKKILSGPMRRAEARSKFFELNQAVDVLLLRRALVLGKIVKYSNSWPEGAEHYTSELTKIDRELLRKAGQATRLFSVVFRNYKR
jgi:hypothetical protein